VKIFRKAKDGGPKSTVTGYWLCEIKRLFSIVLLKFDDGSRDAYHNHAFHSLNWVLRGHVLEQRIDPETGEEISFRGFKPSIWPILTTRSNMHRVVSDGTTWVFSIRGPWVRLWREWSPRTRKFTTLTHGRREVSFDVETRGLAPGIIP
jgi:hypothetical protein